MLLFHTENKAVKAHTYSFIIWKNPPCPKMSAASNFKNNEQKLIYRFILGVAFIKLRCLKFWVAFLQKTPTLDLLWIKLVVGGNRARKCGIKLNFMQIKICAEICQRLSRKRDVHLMLLFMKHSVFVFAYFVSHTLSFIPVEALEIKKLGESCVSMPSVMLSEKDIRFLTGIIFQA